MTELYQMTEFLYLSTFKAFTDDNLKEVEKDSNQMKHQRPVNVNYRVLNSWPPDSLFVLYF